MRHLSAALAVAAVSGVLVVVGPGAVPAAAAGVEDCTGVNSTDTEADPAEGQGEPITSLQVPEAQALLDDPGAGVRIGVIDSGVRPQPGQRVDSRPPEHDPTTEYLQSQSFYYEGTAVAGLINGPEQDDQVIGIAPGAEVVDIPVYDLPATSDEDAAGSDDAVELSVDNVVAGLRTAASLNLDVVNVSLQVEHSPRLLQAVRALTSRGVVVVAASGDVPAEGSAFEDEFGAGRFGDDAAQEIFPAGYASYRGRRDPLVVAATSTVPDGEDPLKYVLPSTATTVAAPTAGGISFGVNGVRCTLETPSSVLAAATVSGVLALLKSRFPEENGRQLVARLTATAAGPPGADPMLPNRFLGAGVIQPLEALTRPVDPAGDGTVEDLAQPTTPNEPATIDPPDPDLLASAREDAVWWALGFGGLIAVLLLLRPVIGSRRSRQADSLLLRPGLRNQGQHVVGGHRLPGGVGDDGVPAHLAVVGAAARGDLLDVRVTAIVSPALTGVMKRSRSRPKLASTGPGSGCTKSPAASETTR